MDILKEKNETFSLYTVLILKPLFRNIIYWFIVDELVKLTSLYDLQILSVSFLLAGFSVGGK